MTQRLFLALCAFLLLVPAACGPGSSGTDAAPPQLDDADGDTIADAHEERADARDSDGDGTPDYQDDDSDNDGVLDRDEAGDADTNTPPIDSDADGIADYLDLDSDDNQIPDSVEGTTDTDGNGIGDWQDPDNDGDSLLDSFELGDGVNNPPDTDGDTVADYMDVDSDGDTVADLHELASDPDQDGQPSYQDLDSDGDCIPDAAEAGDADLSTAPRDSDADAIPDVLELDSDSDGLADGAEDLNCNGLVDAGESSASSADTDGDGATDLIEVTAGTDPQNGTDNPQANGDFVFVVPYEGPTNPNEDDLDFSTNLNIVDVYVLADRSGSMGSEIGSIRTNIQTVANNLTCPPLGNGDPNNCISDLWWGVGTVGYSGTNGQSYTNHLDMQPNPALVTTSLPTTEPAGCCAETLNLGVWSSCSGEGSAAAGCSISTPYASRASCVGSPAGAGGIGFPCFRPNALPVILLATDEAPSQVFTCPGIPESVTAANAIGAKVVGILGSGGVAQVRTDLEAYATGTGAVDANNNNAPLVVQGDNAQAAQAIENGIRLLANGIPLDISAQPSDDPSDSVDAVTSFVDRLETLQLGTAECSNGLTEQDSNNDGFADLYIDVLPGTPVCWRLIPKMNTTVMPTTEPQLFQATIDVYGNDVTLLDARNVYFLVPPVIVDVPID